MIFHPTNLKLIVFIMKLRELASKLGKSIHDFTSKI